MWAKVSRRRRYADKLVFDVGMHCGEDTAFYLAEGCRVVAIEADPSLVLAARQKFAGELEEGRLQILNVGIADGDGTAEFWICDGSPHWNSFHREVAAREGRPHHQVKIPIVRFSRVLADYGVPFYLKIDIEGNDTLCVRDLSGFRPPPFISLESECLGDDAMGDTERGLSALEALRALGYSRFKLIDQETFCNLSLPPSVGYRLDRFARDILLRPPVADLKGSWRTGASLVFRNRLSHRHKWEFPVGSSGVLGPDTDGRWMGFGEAAHAFRYYREEHYRRNPNAPSYSFWCDWHAALP